MSTSDIVNPKDVKNLTSRHEIFSSIYEKYGSPPNWSRPQGFISLSKIILEQQVSLASANAHFLKLDGYINEFTPGEILKLSDEEMRNCHISRQKAKYLRALSSSLLEGHLNLESLTQHDEPEIRKQLTSIKGIGNWTTDIYLMFCLQAKDIFPMGDIAVINTIKELTAIHTREEILKLSESWKPLRSLAAYFCWHHYLSKRNKNSIA
ncbi:MAG: DNA-3-methyladenine glycosylase 2 family protein [Saprospiraceae bacterium]